MLSRLPLLLLINSSDNCSISCTTTNDIKTLNDQLQSLYGAISGLKTDENFTDEQKTDMDDVMSQIDALKQDAEEMQKLLETLMPDNASDAVKDAVEPHQKVQDCNKGSGTPGMAEKGICLFQYS